MQTALITGACGFIGKNLINHLISAGYEIYAIDRVDNACFSDTPAVHYIKSDLADIADIAQSIPKGECDILYHLAWAGVRPEMRADIGIQRSNIDMCIDVITLAKELNIPKVVFIGSTMEYCYNGKPISANSLPTPYNCYGSVKVSTRYIGAQLCRDLGISFNYAVITSIYGAGREDNNVIYYCIDKLLHGETPKLSACVQKWDFVHIDDATNALRLIGEIGADGATYIIGTGENKPLKEYVEIILKLIDNGTSVEFGAVPYKNGVITNSDVDITALVNDTAYSPHYTFERGISEVINYYREKHCNK